MTVTLVMLCTVSGPRRKLRESEEPLLPNTGSSSHLLGGDREHGHGALKKISDFQVTLTLTFRTLLIVAAVLVFAAILGTFAYPSRTTLPETSKSPPPNVGLDLAGNHTVGRLPFMGYNTWNAYYCDISEEKVLNTAKLMKSHGLIDVGYDHMNLDDCYSEKERSPSGDIVANKERFPSGMKHLTNELHKLGLKAGIYSDSGWFTCQLYPGSFLNEARDIKLFQDWGFDLLKYDNCAVPFDEVIREGMIGKYTRMANAIADLAKLSGKQPMLFSLCQWGREQPWIWARRLGQTWRTTEDIAANWPSLSSIINKNSFISWASDFYGHNDMDILEVGNGDLTYDEAKSHFTAWALMKSPLLISTDLSKISKETLEILTNREIIAINQDPVVGTAITPFRWGVNRYWTNNATHPAQYWSGESQNGTVFMLLNVLDHPADMYFNLTESFWIRAGRQYSVRDLWTHTDNGTAIRNFTAYQVPAHGVVALLLKDAGDEPAEWNKDR
ncbi:putative alpha galactosidase A [Lyophyllum shimeji]|uniref:Alpha-galactosidase n=1 Tax=Lyophyllum shimeji TaxID=47721 RepID=A0A9P3Q0S2_LYOSH|nr:putative alpha galactosidase A [Lyophyllum shimeji]